MAGLSSHAHSWWTFACGRPKYRAEQDPKRKLGESCYVPGCLYFCAMPFMRAVSLALWGAFRDAAALSLVPTRLGVFVGTTDNHAGA